MRTLLVALFCAFVIAACDPGTGTGTSSGVITEAGTGDSGPSVDPDRAALCQSYGSDTSACCAQSPGECPRTSADDWQNYCLGYARRCPAMPTCFSGSDCNTLIYCSVGC